MTRQKVMMAIAVLALVGAVGLYCSSVLAQEMKANPAETGAAKAKAPEKAWFMITTTHTPEECLKALDVMSATPVLLKETFFGCKSGDHTGWSIVRAANAEAAKNMLPEAVRANAKVVEVSKFTAAEIKALHQPKS